MEGKYPARTVSGACLEVIPTGAMVSSQQSGSAKGKVCLFGDEVGKLEWLTKFEGDERCPKQLSTMTMDSLAAATPDNQYKLVFMQL